MPRHGGEHAYALVRAHPPQHAVVYTGEYRARCLGRTCIGFAVLLLALSLCAPAFVTADPEQSAAADPDTAALVQRLQSINLLADALVEPEASGRAGQSIPDRCAPVSRAATPGDVRQSRTAAAAPAFAPAAERPLRRLVLVERRFPQV